MNGYLETGRAPVGLKGLKRWGKTMLTVLVCLLSTLGCVNTAHALGIGVTPSTFKLKVDPQGNITGSRDVKFTVTREDKGAFCKKVRFITVSHGINPTLNPDYYKVAEAELKPPLCSFTKEFSGKAFKDSHVKAACQGKAGTNAVLSKKFRMVLWEPYDFAPITLNDFTTLNAEIECTPAVATETYGQVIVETGAGGAAPRVQGSAAGEVTGPARSGRPRPESQTEDLVSVPTCDFSGRWKVWTVNPSGNKQSFTFLRDRKGGSNLRYIKSNPLQVRGHAAVKTNKVLIYAAKSAPPEEYMFFDGTFSADCKSATGDFFSNYAARYDPSYRIERLEGKRPPIPKPKVKGRQTPWQQDRGPGQGRTPLKELDRKRRIMGK